MPELPQIAVIACGGFLKLNVMKKQNFTREEVVQIIEELRERPDQLIDSVSNENTIYDSESLLEIAEEIFN